MRGEYPVVVTASVVVTGSPPLARGILPIASVNIPVTEDHPRLRGEYSEMSLHHYGKPGSPPLARGIQSASSCAVNADGITPACAGNTLCVIKAVSVAWDHPRLRGEYGNIAGKWDTRMGSPPLARGIRRISRWGKRSTGITPACAGNTTSGQTVITAVWDHPRLRGEYSALDALNLFGVGSPPLARGILGNELTPLWKTGITPACAGNTVRKLLCRKC